MDLFHVVEDAFVIVRLRSGVFKQCKVYRRGDQLYAGTAGGFVQLRRNSGTSVPSISWVDAEVAGGVEYDTMGRMKLIFAESKQEALPAPAAA